MQLAKITYKINQMCSHVRWKRLISSLLFSSILKSSCQHIPEKKILNRSTALTRFSRSQSHILEFNTTWTYKVVEVVWHLGYLVFFVGFVKDNGFPSPFALTHIVYLFIKYIFCWMLLPSNLRHVNMNLDWSGFSLQ